MIFGLVRRFVIGSIVMLLILVYVGSYGVLRLAGSLAHYAPVPVVEPRHRVQAPPPDSQNVVEGAIKSTTRLGDFRKIGEKLVESYRSEDKKGHWLDTVYYPLRKLEEAIWNWAD